MASGASPTIAYSPPEGPGTVIGPYKLLEQIGEGGMGVVYMAEQTQPVRRRVALKIIKPGMDTHQVIARFEAERQALALMDHPNIAKVLDAGATDSGRPYFVMELVKGIPITDYCDRAHLPIPGRLDLFMRVCKAVQHAHQKGIIHRDIKPTNVLITLHDGVPVPKVIDFGVAKATGQQLTEKTLFTAFAQMVGTPLYMSPEQAALSGLDIDTRSDIYSLGVLLYELLTGTTPFDAETFRTAAFDEIRRIIREDEPPKPSTRLSSLSETLTSVSANRHSEPRQLERAVQGELDWIVMKALEKDRTRRYETANDLAADVMRHLTDQPVEACPPSAEYRLRKFARRNRAALLTTVMFAGMLLAMSALGTWQAIRATSAEWRASDEAARAVRAEAQARTEAENAKRSAAESEAVRNFLENGLLSAARPEGENGGLGRNVTIRQAVDAVRPQIAEAFKGQPLIEAAVHTTLGETYLSLGENASAIRELERAVELRLSNLGPDHYATLTARNSLATAFSAAGRTAEAITLLEATLKLTESRLGPDHSDTLISRNNLATNYLAADLTAEAIEIVEGTLKLQQSKLGADHPDTLTTRNTLAAAYAYAGRMAEAIKLLETTLKELEANLGPDHHETLISRYNFAAFYIDAGRTAEAIAMHEANLKRMESKLGPDHRDTLGCRWSLANAYLAAGRTAEAIAMHEATLKLMASKLGPDHPDTLHCRNSLARDYQVVGRLTDALPLFEDTLKRYQAKLGRDHSQTLIVMNNLAGAYLEAQRWAEAEPLARDCLGLRAKKMPQEWWNFHTMSQLGAALAGQKKYAEAEPLLLQGYEGLKARSPKIPAPAKKKLAEAATRIVKLYEALGKPEKAAEWRKKRETGKEP